MPKVIGPDTPLDVRSGIQSSLEVDAQTLGAALEAYQRAFAAVLAPYDGSVPDLPLPSGEPPKWFFYSDASGKRSMWLVDIHVERGDVVICPKQNLAFELKAGDVVRIGPVTC